LHRTLHGHQLKRRLSALKPLTWFDDELGQALAVEPRAVRAADIANAYLPVLKQDLRVATRGLWIIEDDVA
jgi:hypothetical protein